jgi:hypothetical protein
MLPTSGRATRMPIESFIQAFIIQGIYEKSLHRWRKEWIPITHFRYPHGYIVSGGAVRKRTAFVDYTKTDVKEKGK